MGKGFRRRILEKSSEKGSRIILAFDEYGGGEDVLKKLSSVCESLGKHVAGIKIGVPTMFSTGLAGLRSVITQFKDEYVFISDAKMADISNTNSLTARILYETGFDAIISHGFVGYEGGLEGLFQEAEKQGGGVIMVVSMSHAGSREFIDPNTKRLVEIVVKHGADGVVAPATRTSVIREVRSMVGESLLILTPGVGAQGAPYGKGLSAGADFEIIGRSIMNSSDPVRIAMEVKGEHERALVGRTG